MRENACPIRVAPFDPEWQYSFSGPHVLTRRRVYPRVLRDTPSFAAITVVAPTVRFNALAILAAPFLSFAIVFNVRISSFDHARRTTFFFLAKSRFLFLRSGLVA